MKAILCKIMPPTHTKPRRIKIMADGVKPASFSYNSCDPNFIQVAIENFARFHGWLEGHERMAHGQLPNGDYVACFI